MLRSLYASISGLRSHQMMMDVTANNIANVNTQGFKAGRALFADALSQTVRGGGVPTDANGSINPLQIGLGSRVAAVTTNFNQGALQLTGRVTDLAIQGNGFFVVERSGTRLLTRDGAFNWDSQGQLVTAGGARVLGWTTDPVTGGVNPSTVPGFISVPTSLLEPEATTRVVLDGNMSAGTLTGDFVASSGTVHDSIGTAFDLAVTFTKTGTGTWTAAIKATAPDGTVNDITPAVAPTLVFNAVGALVSPTSIALTGITLGTGAPQDITLELGDAQHAITQYDQVSSIDMPIRDGSAGAELSSVNFGSDGSVNAQYTNGDSKVVGMLALASVTNPEGMLKAADNLWEMTLTSGDAAYGLAGTEQFGVVAPGALEGSNVDLATEFTNLVLAQRGFQANTRVITTSDEMLADLVNVKR
ncbi:MAG: flagellar hook protein FlgE [Actinobacteria bacterium]|nr:flagellar hook protein FlgE [Actinomycetota bacterium]